MWKRVSRWYANLDQDIMILLTKKSGHGPGGGHGVGGCSLLIVNTLEAGPWLAARKRLSRGFSDSFPSGLLSCPSRWPSSYHFLSRVSHSAFKGNSYTLREEKYILFFFFSNSFFQRLTSKRPIGLIKHKWLTCLLPTPKLTSVFSSFIFSFIHILFILWDITLNLFECLNVQ